MSSQASSTQLRRRTRKSNPLRKVNHASSSSTTTTMPRPSLLTPHTTAAAAVLAALIVFGTVYDLLYRSAQSEVFVQLMTPQTPTASYWANKHNIFNQYFVKLAWGWTTLAFLAHFATSPPGLRKPVRVLRYAMATLAFLAFTAWFFGPAMLDRVRVLSGGECVLVIPSSTTGESLHIPVPETLCYSRTPISPLSHPEYFIDTDTAELSSTIKFLIPRIRRGHDISGHIFLLTLSTLFLIDEITPTFSLLIGRAGPRPKHVQRGEPHWVATMATAALVGLWAWMTLITSVYFHTPQEKLSGFVVGLLAFAFSQLPLLFFERESTLKQEQ